MLEILINFLYWYLGLSFIIYFIAFQTSLFITSVIKVVFIKEDLWVGLFISRKRGKYYLTLIPMIVILIHTKDEDYL